MSAGADLARCTRAAQGLPRTVTDPATLDRVAQLLNATNAEAIPHLGAVIDHADATRDVCTGS